MNTPFLMRIAGCLLIVCAVGLVSVIGVSLPSDNAGALDVSDQYYSDFEPVKVASSNHIQNMPSIHGNYISWLDSRVNDKAGKIFPRIYIMDIRTGKEKKANSFAKKSGAMTQYRNKVVWAENIDRLRENNFDIKCYDFNNNSIEIICNDKSMQSNPQISEEYIIWNDKRDTDVGSEDPWDFAVYGVDADGGEEFVIKDHETPGVAELFGRYIALSIINEETKDWDIYLSIPSSSKRIPICTADGDQYNPGIINESFVVWEDTRNAPEFGFDKPGDIYGYSIKNHKEVFISIDRARDYGLIVGDQRYCLWFRESGTTIGGLENTIHGYDTIAEKEFAICLDPGDHRKAVIGEDWIVWEVHTHTSFGSDLMAYHIESDRTYTLYKAYGDQMNPSIYRNCVVWENHGRPESEDVSIWYADLDKLVNNDPKDTRWGFASRPVWNQSRADDSNSGVGIAQIRDLDRFEMKQQWKTKLDGSIASEACFDRSSFAYVGTSKGKDGYFYKVSAFTGEIIWETAVEGGIRSSPSIYKDRAFIGTSSGKFYCFNTETGKEIWSIQVDDAIDTSPTIFLSEIDHYPMVIFSSTNKSLYMYSVRGNSPNKRWEIKLDGWVKGTVAVGYNRLLRVSRKEPIKKYIYAGLSSNRIVCIDPATAQIVAFFPTDSSIKSAPIAIGPTCIATSGEGTLYNFDFSGWGKPPQLHVEEKTYHRTSSSPVYDKANRILCFESDSGAISFRNGNNQWTASIDKTLSSSPSLSTYGESSVIFVPSSDGQLFMIDTASGEILWNASLETRISSSPSILDTGFISIIIGTNDSYLYCWGQRPKNLD